MISCRSFKLIIFSFISFNAVILWGCKTADPHTSALQSVNITESEMISYRLNPKNSLPVHEYTTIEVFPGERICDLVSRMEKKGFFSSGSFEKASENFHLSFFYQGRPPPVHDSRRLEGLFVPGSYRIRNLIKNSNSTLPDHKDGIKNAEIIIKTLLEHTLERFANLEYTRGISPYELLILASVVEKEDVYDSQTALVASVFWNRFRGGGKLGSCPTVEYALGYHRLFLLNSDLEDSKDSPWNTYYYRGLMPTPICFVSDHTLMETINAKQTNFYYMVMDWSRGTITPASSYEAHKKNVASARSNTIKAYGETLLRKRMDNYYYDYLKKNSQ